MKKIFLVPLLLLSILMTNCKPDPTSGEDGDNFGNDTLPETPLVRKYLTKELLNDDPEKIILFIDWNEDCSQIRNVKYSMGYGSTANYKFTYYGEDSVCIEISIVDNLPNWSPYYDSMIIHLNDIHNIDEIYCYANNELQDIEKYHYDINGKLSERIYWNGTNKDTFVWEGNNVIKAVINGRDHSYELTNMIHPHYAIPFYMSDQIFETGGKPFLMPLWENMIKENCDYEIDDDNYITKKIYKNCAIDSIELFHSFYYTTPNK